MPPGAPQLAARNPIDDAVDLCSRQRRTTPCGVPAQHQVEIGAKPIIARVNGHAVGLGATIALLCDIIIAADHAKIGDPHVNAGLVAGDGGALIWPQLIGFARAKEYLFTGDLMTAAEAERIGLINHVVPADQLDDKVYGLARRLAGGAMRSIRGTKEAINIPLRQLAHSMMDLSLSLETQSNLSEDHQEAVWAFAQKRRPNFTGR
jgi:enoyl-CoA hydratase